MNNWRLVYTIIAVHLLLVIAHAAAHLQLSIFLPSLWQNLFVVSVIVLAPLAAALLGRMGRERLGAATLAGAMAGALLFGTWHHFVAASPDHVSSVPASFWGQTFRFTAGLMFVTEIVGIGVGARLISTRSLQFLKAQP
jgi:hypothetical protein